MERKPVLASVKEAAVQVDSGMTIAIGGFISSNIPMAIIREIIRNEVKDLTIVAIPTGLEIDLLIASGCVKTLIVPYLGAEAITPISPVFRKAAENCEVEIFEVDSGMVLAALKAGMAGLPFAPWRGGIGTSLPDINPTLKTFRDPIENELLVAIPAIVPDVALIHAAYADPYGNIQHYSTSFADPIMARAAKTTIVQVEQLVPPDTFLGNPQKVSIPAIYVDCVVKVPYGSHPYASEGFYVADIEHLQAYIKDVNIGALSDYLNAYVLNPINHEDYLEFIGIKRLLSLGEY